MNTEHTTRRGGRLTAMATLALAGAVGAGVAASPHAMARPSSTAASSAAESAQAGGPLLVALPPPDQFVGRVDNPYLPLKPGTRWVYRGSGSEAGERVVVKVLRRTKLIEGITATVVHDVATVEGEVIEDTFDWFAQDERGRVWYLGEATTSYEDGEVSTEGSWMTGVDGAVPGIAMWQRPRIGLSYYQEFSAGEAEDVGELLKTGLTVDVRGERFKRAWMTLDTTPLEPDATELKVYARGVGPVLTLDLSPEQGRSELVRMDRR